MVRSEEVQCVGERVQLFRHEVEALDGMGLFARKPVFGVSDKASFDTDSSATETS